MKNNKPCNVTSPFVAQHAADVTGVLCGLDRLRLRGTLRALYQPTVLLRFLFVCQVLLKGFKNYAIGLTRRIIDHAWYTASVCTSTFMTSIRFLA